MAQALIDYHFEFEKPFPCHLCGFVGFQKKRRLIEHLREYHNFEEDEISLAVVDFLIMKLKREDEEVALQEIPKIEEPTVFVKNPVPVVQHDLDHVAVVKLKDFVQDLPFAEGDLVIAKLGRHPWWPAIILKCQTQNSIFKYSEPNFGVKSDFA